MKNPWKIRVPKLAFSGKIIYPLHAVYLALIDAGRKNSFVCITLMVLVGENVSLANVKLECVIHSSFGVNWPWDSSSEDGRLMSDDRSNESIDVSESEQRGANR